MTRNTPSNSSAHDAAAASIKEKWLAHWPGALAQWGKFTRLSPPKWCTTAEDEAREGLSGSLAMIRFPDHFIAVSIPQIIRYGLADYGLEILAHEIGHHILCPSDLSDQGRMLARMRKGLPTKEQAAPYVANLYADLLINDRLQRQGLLRLPEIYRHIDSTDLSPPPRSNNLWTFYMRIYELLWRLPARELAKDAVSRVMEADAQLAARLIRSYARQWLDGSGRFAALCLPYLMDEKELSTLKSFVPLLDGISSKGAASAHPDGLTEIEADEEDGAIHPSLDPELSGTAEQCGEDETERAGKSKPQPSPVWRKRCASGRTGQYREPFEYGEILRSLGLTLSDEEIAVRYYRERAIPHLVPYPTIVLPESQEPLLEGLEPWDAGSPLEDLDWLQSILASPQMIPGVTTVQRTWGTCEGRQPSSTPLDLDLYVDSSGSMPNPMVRTSYLALAGVIIALSALRAGARVQATLWSGTRQFKTTSGFVSSEEEILGIITGHIGGPTAFPIHILRDTHRKRKPAERAAHILVISDDGCDTMFDRDEKGADGFQICRQALSQARGGGTLALNIFADAREPDFCRRAREIGFEIYRVQQWEQLEQFSRAFSARKYGKEASAPLRRKAVP